MQSGSKEPARPRFAPGASPMEALVSLSRYYGGNPEFVLAGGGNTSVKVGDTLYVKASGRALASIDEKGFAALDRRALSALLEAPPPAAAKHREKKFKEAILAARLEPEKGLRPSVECVLHDVLPEKFVVHTHSTLVNMIACCTEGERIVGELFGDDCLWIPYVDPGFVLAITLAEALKEYKARTGRTSPGVVVMQNHGLVVSGETPEDVLKRTDAVISKVRGLLEGASGGEPFGAVTSLEAAQARRLIGIIGPALRGLLAEQDALKVVTFDDSALVMSLAGGRDGSAVATEGALTPDQIVYCGAFPVWFECAAGDESPEEIVWRLREALGAHKAAGRPAPRVVIVKGLGMFAAGDDFAAAETARLVWVDAIRVAAGARRLGGIRFLSQGEREFIESWEAEAYRRKVSARKVGGGRAAGKVAMVTGAAQGFGLEIARDLVREGAHVALGDINADGVRKAAEELAAEAGGGRAVSLVMDVADAESVSRAVYQIVRKYGGFDIVVSNAGVLRAGSVKTQDPAEFDLVTRVNYRGYFLCVHAAAPVLAVEHLAKPDYWSDIIQVNSKSGLVGSNRNAAYAGSKFGGIGLTQSFALELVEDHIKVNSICPGNFFDGPLWSDPENGLFVQYLRSGKVPGAKAIEDVRRAYETKVPMGRGCTTADVMHAVYYCIEQKYETGQAVAVTGGQVMLG